MSEICRGNIGLRGPWPRRLWRPIIGLLVAFAMLPMLFSGSAEALQIELLDVAPDRVERQRAFVRGEGPLPDTPDTQRLAERLAAKGLAAGNPIFIRIFKLESQLELWMRKDDTFVLLDSYPICHWTGTLGPKLREGDKQSPEGFYSIARPQLRHLGRWRRALNIGFPNVFDQLQQRTGSYILIHGGCSSTGCFAMTGPVQDEIHQLAEAAIRNGQQRVHIHVFPFRMTDENMRAQAQSIWRTFWEDLRSAYDSFERTRVPPRIEVCKQRYVVADGELGETGDPRPLSIARASRVATTDGGAPISSCSVRPQMASPPRRVADLRPPNSEDRAEAAAVMSDAPIAEEKSARPIITGALRSYQIRRHARRLPRPHRALPHRRVKRPSVVTQRQRSIARHATRRQQRSGAADWMKPYAAAAERARQFAP